MGFSLICRGVGQARPERRRRRHRGRARTARPAFSARARQSSYSGIAPDRLVGQPFDFHVDRAKGRIDLAEFAPGLVPVHGLPNAQAQGRGFAEDQIGDDGFIGGGGEHREDHAGAAFLHLHRSEPCVPGAGGQEFFDHGGIKLRIHVVDIGFDFEQRTAGQGFAQPQAARRWARRNRAGPRRCRCATVA